ncbi:MAG: hypothetical protein COT00_01315 [Candidatus Omnitrophica bacterium CG07_land_8_20_14_0_80_50_8]|nr:MAG: hypothetical protein AUJ71_00870 [Candidatus Omnitrophica bacterium CG1_02_49_16]PIU40513.1 MAG: hypothetical protein COT00_01315 [Candidatus Omnitrophica bacterium CG07_land_8_20_14_0_80_50_8]
MFCFHHRCPCPSRIIVKAFSSIKRYVILFKSRSRRLREFGGAGYMIMNIKTHKKHSEDANGRRMDARRASASGDATEAVG